MFSSVLAKASSASSPQGDAIQGVENREHHQPL